MDQNKGARLLCIIGTAWLVLGCGFGLPFTVPRPTIVSEKEEGVLKAAEFSSDGDLIQGWYWLRDADHQKTARWVFTDVPEGRDLTLRWSVLATDSADGGGGSSAKFIVIYGVPKSGAQGWLTLGSKMVTLQNMNDPSGYLCEGKTTLFRSELSGSLSTETVWFMAGRQDPNGVFLPVDLHIAFNAGSLVLEDR